MTQKGRVKSIETVYTMDSLIRNVKYTSVLNWILPLAKGTKLQNRGQVLLGILEEGWNLFNSAVVKNSSRGLVCRQVYLAMIWCLELSVEGKKKGACCLFWSYCIAEARDMVGLFHSYCITQNTAASSFCVSLERKCLIHHFSLK